MPSYGEWQPIRGSYMHIGNVNDIVVYGGSNFTGNVPNAPTPPAGYGRGARGVLSDDRNTISLQIDTLAVGVYASSGLAYASRYANTSAVEYDWVIRWRTTTTVNDNPSSIPNSNWGSWTQRNLVTRRGGDALYWTSGWQNTGTVNGTITLYTNPFPDNLTWIMIEIRGNNEVVEPIYAYLPWDALITEYRPMAIRKSGIFRSLDNAGGLLKIRKSSNFIDINLMSQSDDKAINRGSCRIRKSGNWIGQSRIGE